MSLLAEVQSFKTVCHCDCRPHSELYSPRAEDAQAAATAAELEAIHRCAQDQQVHSAFTTRIAKLQHASNLHSPHAHPDFMLFKYPSNGREVLYALNLPEVSCP